ncbi:hypothetical protein [Actinoplanes campanulatus]|uniref:hypothetical protein n=1 Tax=Actinoplanes campanulatus TaxID=113559 RepID=UPI001944BD79|nr:hypothetical protein [Actinoplanes campanulatus]GID40174.1 hypothetical protein Aca09nite_66800 [Actinoplanes campanulatus]
MLARTIYGGSVDDVVITPVTIGTTQVAGLPASQNFEVWNYANTEQLTDIQDGSGVALPSGIVVSSSAGVIPQFKAPDDYTGPIRLKHVTSGLSWVMQPSDGTSGGGGSSLPNTLVVASADSGILDADWVCDGTADDVQLQAAVTATALGTGPAEPAPNDASWSSAPESGIKRKQPRPLSALATSLSGGG